MMGGVSKYIIGSWSRKVICSEIECHGTPGVIERLPTVGGCKKEDHKVRWVLLVGGWSAWVQR